MAFSAPAPVAGPSRRTFFCGSVQVHDATPSPKSRRSAREPRPVRRLALVRAEASSNGTDGSPKKDFRVILLTGKGGVGKTSVAAATGLQCAELGYKTLVLSTDPAHSLADSFDMELSHQPKKVAERLYGAELDAIVELEMNWGGVKRYITEVLQARGLEGVQAEELAILPGMDEIFGLVRMKREADSGEFDVLIVDSAPTGTALRLLSLPEVAGWYMRRFYKPLQGMANVLNPVFDPLFKQVTGFSLPSKEVMDVPFDLYEDIEALQRVLCDPSKTTVRLVTNPEKMVIKESLRAHAYLSLYGVATDLVVCNRVLPDSIADPYFARWKEAQRGYREEIRQDFHPLPVKEVPMFGEELCGLAQLDRLRETLYPGREDPTRVYHSEVTMRVAPAAEGKGYSLEVFLPGIPKSEVKLTKTGDELNIRIGNHRRNVVLPQALAGLQPRGAKMEADYLRIAFA